jgi:hypothetical protein
MIDLNSVEIHAAHRRNALLAEADHVRLIRRAQERIGTGSPTGSSMGNGARAPLAHENVLVAELRYVAYLAGRLLVNLGQRLVALSHAGAAPAV